MTRHFQRLASFQSFDLTGAPNLQNVEGLLPPHERSLVPVKVDPEIIVETACAREMAQVTQRHRPTRVLAISFRGRFLFGLGADFLVRWPVGLLVLLGTILDLLAAGTEEAGASIATGVAAGSSCRLRDGWGIFRWGVISE